MLGAENVMAVCNKWMCTSAHCIICVSLNLQGCIVSLDKDEDGSIAASMEDNGLLYDIHYEPPSPKFKRHAPGPIVRS
jgi:hypothetical protein